MKKIFTLLFCTAILSSAFAQQYGHGWNDQGNFYRDHDDYRGHYDRDHDRDHDHDRRGFGPNYFMYQNNRYQFDQRDELIQRVSYRYDYRVRQVINDWSLSPREKRYAIRNLRYRQAQEIDNINEQCNHANSITIYGGNNYRRYHRDDD